MSEMKPATITPFAPAGRDGITKMSSGAYRSAVHRDMKSEQLLAGADVPAAEFERTVERLENDIKLPDRYRAQLIDEARTKEYEAVERLWIAEMDTQLQQIKQDRQQLKQDEQQDVPPPSVLVDYATIDRITDVTALRKQAESWIRRGNVAQLRRVLPEAVNKGTLLAANTNDIAAKRDAAAIRAMVDTFARTYPDFTDRHSEIDAREARIEPDSTARFHRSLNVLGIKR